MNTIEQMLTGQMEMSEFITQLKSDPTLQSEVRNLISHEAAHNESHPLWKRISFEAFQNSNYDFLQLLCRLSRFDGTIGENLNIWGTIHIVYSYYHPELPYTGKYKETYGLYLDAIRDCFDGPEVEQVVEKIILNAMEITPKSKRLQNAKKEVENQFHITDRKRPRWIQGAEWPMGEKSPMKFIMQKRKGELVQYFFEDTDTGANRIVEQFY